MSKWARIENNRVMETTDVDPSGRFHPSLVWVQCSDEVESGFIYVNNVFEAPPPPAPTTGLDLAPNRSFEGLSDVEIKAFEDLAKIINENPDALKQAVE